MVFIAYLRGALLLLGTSRAVLYNAGHRWSVPWAPVASPDAPHWVRSFNAETGELYPNRNQDGWMPTHYHGISDRGSQNVGLQQVEGHYRESAGFISKSARGFVEVLIENMATEIHCRGAAPTPAFYGAVSNRQQQSTSCVSACQKHIGTKLASGNHSRRDLVQQSFASECDVPIVHTIRGKAFRTITADGPTATVHIPRQTFQRAGIQRREDLVEFLLKVAVSQCPPNITLGSGRNWVFERPVDNPFEYLDFNSLDQWETPRFRAGSVVHYSSYTASTMNGPSNAGYYVDRPVVVSSPSQFTFILDVASSFRRIWDTEHLAIALLSTCDIQSIDEEFVFKRAVNWLYTPESEDCARQTTCQACREHGCTWCRRRAEGDDFLDVEWRAVAGVNPWGRCGVPQSVCIAHYGTLGHSTVC